MYFPLSIIRGQYCANEDCALFQVQNANNIVVHSRKDERLRCKECGKTWVVHRDQASYRLHLNDEELQQMKELLDRGLSIRKVAVLLETSPSTIQRWKKKLYLTPPFSHE